MEDRDYTQEEYEEICDYIDSMSDKEILELRETLHILMNKKNEGKIVYNLNNSMLLN